MLKGLHQVSCINVGVVTCVLSTASRSQRTGDDDFIYDPDRALQYYMNYIRVNKMREKIIDLVF